MSLSKLRTVAPMEEGSAIRDALDPDGRLPDIFFSKDEDHDPFAVLGRDGEPTYGFHIIDAGTRSKVGSLALAERQDTGDYHISYIEVDPDSTGAGYGMAAHTLAIEIAGEDGVGFVNDRKLTGDSVRVWQHLIDAEIAVLLSPFEGDDPGLPHDQQTYYRGDVRIDPSYL